ncbi:hypothetical protein ACFSKY_12915 [Azotobacter chroococcum]|uniref:Uracil DNA glycosylase superfamily protein n=1 Tax=Azotobacter chroococcum TaxID=353 RepID=A0A4V2Q7A7_9GAMM|nr:hypothetical protein [Azotobacter chroococcum]TBV99185.1 hypothetical protein E0E53_03865 [Azotobacter chroococcum]TCL29604.1 hypothetical protein EV691_11648 [Azotobacter chroococcum]
MNIESIAEEYLSIIRGIDRALIDKSRHHEPEFSGLTGIFIPSLPRNYSSAKYRIMVVGRETKGWSVLKDNESFSSLEQYILSALTKHQMLQEKFLARPCDKGFSYFNLLRSIAARCGSDGLIWSNLFCFAWNKGNPMCSPQFSAIKYYSELLLKLQIRLFKPEIIIFANGSTTAMVRQEFFPYKGEGSVCTNASDFSLQGIPNKQLWQFQLYDQIQCYRIQHPSSRGRDSQAARKFLLNMLPMA